jgi:DNA-binding GntR family transcriptional regulator
MSTSPLLPSVPSKADQVYEYLRENILSGVYKPEQRLSMDALAKELGVSKIPVREAIGRLEAQSLVISQQHIGPTVSAVSVVQLQGVYLARERLEPLIASIAARTISGTELVELDGIQAAMKEALQAGSLDKLGDLNYRFHLGIAHATNFDIFIGFSETLLLSVRRHRVSEPLDTSNWQSVITEHDAILAALKSGDVAAAAAAAELHATSQADHDIASFLDGNLADKSARTAPPEG